MKNAFVSFSSRLYFAAFLGIAACGGVGESIEADERIASSESDLTRAEWSVALSKLNALSYLPWTFKIDGCYARALYYSMTLAAEKVPSSLVYIVENGRELSGGPGVSWGWHVAPLVAHPDTFVWYVLDPAFDAKAPIRLRDWVAKQGFPDRMSQVYPTLTIKDANDYMEAGMRGIPIPRTEATPKNSPSNDLEPEFAKLPSFRIGDVNDACITMHSYIDYESTTPTVKRTKHQGLARASSELVTKLATLRKLSGTTSQLSRRCTAY